MAISSCLTGVIKSGRQSRKERPPGSARGLKPPASRLMPHSICRQYIFRPFGPGTGVSCCLDFKSECRIHQSATSTFSIPRQVQLRDRQSSHEFCHELTRIKFALICARNSRLKIVAQITCNLLDDAGRYEEQHFLRVARDGRAAKHFADKRQGA
jgi:hypothetical protein